MFPAESSVYGGSHDRAFAAPGDAAAEWADDGCASGVVAVVEGRGCVVAVCGAIGAGG